MALVCMSLQAQGKHKDATMMKQGWIYSRSAPKAETDSLTGKLTVKWPSTEDRHIKGRDGIVVSDVPVSDDWRTLMQMSEGISRRADDELVPFTWLLNREDDMTVLHCYMRMPADAVTNFWLTSEEAAIVDQDTGTQYRAIGCLPKDCWKKYFTINAPKDSTLDFRVFFPRLPETVKRVKIYGVPNWGLRGSNELDLKVSSLDLPCFDDAPQMHKSRLVRPAVNYDNNSSGSWSVYTDAHTIRPLPEGTMALWCTPEATYLAISHEQNWMREYYGCEKGGMLLDGSGHQYKLKDMLDYPLGQLFWIEGYSGDCTVTVLVYEPLSPNVETFTYVDPDGEPFKAWGANWKGSVKHGLNVEELRRNQRLFEYYPRQIVDDSNE